MRCRLSAWSEISRSFLGLELPMVVPRPLGLKRRFALLGSVSHQFGSYRSWLWSLVIRVGEHLAGMASPDRYNTFGGYNAYSLPVLQTVVSGGTIGARRGLDLASGGRRFACDQASSGAAYQGSMPCQQRSVP